MKMIARLLATLQRLLAGAVPTDHRPARGQCAPNRRRRPRPRAQTEAQDRDAFRFAPELFETRTDVIAELSDRGFDWLSHYSSVDPIHDCYGIEVCGIHDQDDAVAIQRILIELFPDWRPG